MKRIILTIEKDSEALRKVSQPVKIIDFEVEKLVVDLIDTLLVQDDPPGLGLSAPQIGVLKRVFVARLVSDKSERARVKLGQKGQDSSSKNKSLQEDKKNIKAFINPEITKFSNETADFLEGCLSVPNFYGHVIRPAKITLKAKDRSGKNFKRSFQGLLSRIIQHEIDHLNGALFIDHVHHQKGKLYKFMGKDNKGEEKFAEVVIE
ncbi:MAG TPA: peptide deformylase [Patescibacteria group bacterium]